jgi:hypothetical protein
MCLLFHRVRMPAVIKRLMKCGVYGVDIGWTESR